MVFALSFVAIGGCSQTAGDLPDQGLGTKPILPSGDYSANNTGYNMDSNCDSDVRAIYSSYASFQEVRIDRDGASGKVVADVTYSTSADLDDEFVAEWVHDGYYWYLQGSIVRDGQVIGSFRAEEGEVTRDEIGTAELRFSMAVPPGRSEDGWSGCWYGGTARTNAVRSVPSSAEGIEAQHGIVFATSNVKSDAAIGITNLEGTRYFQFDAGLWVGRVAAAWRPGNQQVSWWGSHNGSHGVVVADPDSVGREGPYPETGLPNSCTEAHAWSGDGMVLAVGTQPCTFDGDYDGVWIVDMLDGSAYRETPMTVTQQPHLSPDGSELVYSGGVYDPAIYITTVGIDDNRVLVADGRYPRWSPDGAEVLYWTDEIGRGQLHAIDPESEVSRLVADTDALDASWSSDGSRIVFVRDGDIWTMRADGSSEQLVFDCPGTCRYPKWSPQPLDANWWD